MDKAIEVFNLSKAYQLGAFGTGTISNDLARYWAKLRGKEDPFLKIGETNDRRIKGTSDIVWSLRDINFKIDRGNAVGIIGRNGAGKSTLLKILSRTTAPTTGSVKMRGRVASLLEVGTGFHPELSGRDNIFLNGAILGMRKAEIKQKFDEIVAFSGVERYIDTPVKRYSSGMYVRLAFAVAAHLESEILIVDEVLSVGDAEFQQKCLGKIGQVSKGEGRTVLFVSHNLAAVSQICSTSILLENGLIKKIGETSQVVDTYLKTEHILSSHIDLTEYSFDRKGNRKAKFKEVYLKNAANNDYSRVFSIGDTVNVFFKLEFFNPNENFVKTSVELKTSDGTRIAHMIDVDSGYQVKASPGQSTLYCVAINDIRLYPGTYYLSLYAGDMTSSEAYDHLENCISFDIIDGGKLTERWLPRSAGLIFLTPEWSKV